MSISDPSPSLFERLPFNAGYAATTISRINRLGITYTEAHGTIEAVLCNNDDDGGQVIKLSLDGWHHLINAIYQIHPNTTVTHPEIMCAARILERMSTDYPIASPTDMKWSANTLRHEAELCYRSQDSATVTA